MTSTPDERYVLLVDDHDDGRELLDEFLTMSGFEVEPAASAEAALGVVDRRGAPRIVITDLTLGAMSGAELAQRLRHEPATSSVPVVAVTGHSGFEDDERLFSAVLVKPIVLNNLVDTVKRLSP